MDEYLDHARRELGPKMASSAYVITIAPDDEVDPKVALETGYAILLNKPILLVGWPGRSIPAGLRRVATEVVELSAPISTERGQQELMARIAAFNATVPA